MRTAYQILTISKAFGFVSIIPDPIVYITHQDALDKADQQMKVFRDNQETVYFKGDIYTLAEIANICQAIPTEIDDEPYDEIYILRLEVAEDYE